MDSPDQIRRFIFEGADIRGEVASLDQSMQEALRHQSLPAAVRCLLGEFLAAVSLLSATLKFNGVLTLQARGEGALPLVMAECRHNQSFRCIAHPREGAVESEFDGDFRDMMGPNAVLSITIDPDQGNRYQGIVPLDAPTLAGCLEHYFDQSEQLPTRFWLAASETQSTGLLLQALPRQIEADSQTNEALWENVTILAETVTTEEMLELDHETLLYRLFNEYQVRLFEAVPLQFACSCSRARCENTLLSLGEQEAMNILTEQGVISMDCQFCNQHYEFTEPDVLSLFNPTLH